MLRSLRSTHSLMALVVAACGGSAPSPVPQAAPVSEPAAVTSQGAPTAQSTGRARQPTTLPKDARPTVAVLYFDNGAVGRAAEFEPLRKAMADMFITELMKNTNLRIVERDQLQAIIEELDLAKTKYIDKQTAVHIGKLLSAQHLVMGAFVVDPRGTMRIDARAINVETSELEHSETVTDQADNLLNLVPALASKFIAFVPPPVLPPPAPAAKSGDLRYLITYARAMDAQDDHDKTRAVALYKEFLQTSPPTLLVAQRKLAEERVGRLQASPR